jgi:hypothetical protein
MKHDNGDACSKFLIVHRNGFDHYFHFYLLITFTGM